jgi:hypothetical protein
VPHGAASGFAPPFNASNALLPSDVRSTLAFAGCAPRIVAV